MSSYAEKPTRRSHGHHWTKIELDIVLGLVCKGRHLQLSTLEFATKLNEALNGSKSRTAYDNDIPVEDVRGLLAHIETEKKGSLAFIERQPHPHVMTRTKKRMFERNIPFTGSKQEWAAARKDKVKAMKERDKMMRNAGLENTSTSARGVQSKGWAPGGGQLPINLQGHPNSWMAGDHFPHPSNGQQTPFGWNHQGHAGLPTPQGQCELSYGIS
jgi:hypothetical protein